MAKESNGVKSSPLSFVRGNDANVIIRLYEQRVSGGKTSESKLDLSQFGKVNIIVDSGDVRQKIEWNHSVEANALVLKIPHTLPVGSYSLEFTAVSQGDTHVRSFGFAFKVVERNSEASTTLDVVNAYKGAGMRVTVQVVAQALVLNKTDYELWKEHAGNEDGTLTDFVEALCSAYNAKVMTSADAKALFDRVFEAE